MRTRLLLLIDVVLVCILGIISEPFRSPQNLVVLVDNLALESIALTAMTLLLIGGLFDLSLDGVVALTGVVAGEIMLAGMDPSVAILGALLAGALVGAVNGVAVNHWKLNPLMVTLATGWAAIGITLGVTTAIAPFGYPEWFQAIGQTRVLGFRAFVYYALIIVALGSLILHFTVTGRHIYAIGGARRSAVLCGVKANKLGLLLYVQAGLVAAFIGIVMASRLNASSPFAVDGMGLRVIAAAVIGGCSLSGGRGSVWAGLLGLVLMSVLTNAAILLHVSPYWQKGLIGGILFLAILSERLGKRETNGA